MEREPGPKLVRRAMTLARKRRIWTANEGRCWLCNEPVEMTGPGVRYDHRIGLWITQRDRDDDVSPSHTACDRPKTRKDLRVIAHLKRLIARREGKVRPKRKIASPGFDKRLSRKMDGSVEPRIP